MQEKKRPEKSHASTRSLTHAPWQRTQALIQCATGADTRSTLERKKT